MRTRKEEIEGLEGRIKGLRKRIDKKRDAIEHGSKKTGKPLSESTMKAYRAEMNSYIERVKSCEKEIEELKNRPKKFDDFWNMVHGELVGAAYNYYQESQSLENKLLEWEEWYKRQDRRPPMKKKEVPQGWQVFVGGVQG
jgi:predicted  nucleic acid-binding Zn-ribbon protein